MRWVNDTLPPRERARWLLMTTRLSMSSLAGPARSLVAVGTVSDDSMLVTVRALAPRSGLTSSWLTGPVDFGACGSRGLGCSLAAAASLSSGLSATAVSVFASDRSVVVACALPESVADDALAVVADAGEPAWAVGPAAGGGALAACWVGAGFASAGADAAWAPPLAPDPLPPPPSGW